jgi:hypothetical protein
MLYCYVQDQHGCDTNKLRASVLIKYANDYLYGTIISLRDEA